MTWHARRKAIRMPAHALPLQAPKTPQPRQAPLTPAQLTRARLRGALGFLQDVVHDADLLTPATRQQVFTALRAVSEAIALATAQED